MKKKILGVVLLAMATANTFSVIATDSFQQEELKLESLESQAFPGEGDNNGNYGTKWVKVSDCAFEDGYLKGQTIEMYQCKKDEKSNNTVCDLNAVCYKKTSQWPQYGSMYYDGRYGTLECPNYY